MNQFSVLVLAYIHRDIIFLFPYIMWIIYLDSPARHAGSKHVFAESIYIYVYKRLNAHFIFLLKNHFIASEKRVIALTLFWYREYTSSCTELFLWRRWNYYKPFQSLYWWRRWNCIFLFKDLAQIYCDCVAIQ